MSSVLGNIKQYILSRVAWYSESKGLERGFYRRTYATRGDIAEGVILDPQVADTLRAIVSADCIRVSRPRELLADTGFKHTEFIQVREYTCMPFFELAHLVMALSQIPSQFSLEFQRTARHGRIFLELKYQSCKHTLKDLSDRFAHAPLLKIGW